MCGINGILRLRPEAAVVDPGELRSVRDRMASRGPDGIGEWFCPSGRIGLGHRRLAIIDLSDAAAQPMATADERFHLIFNGEIYNYASLRSELLAKGASFRTSSDSEVLLALYAREGVGMLPRLRGMYAFALWDNLERALLLARDPYGIKPLYYTDDGTTLRFASQLTALAAGHGVPEELDPAGLAGFLLWGSVPEPHTIRRGVRSLSAGHHLFARGGRVEAPRPHHRFGDNAELPAGTVEQAVEDSVRDHLVADVPVAVFLSGGLDSALVAALAARHLPEPPRSFTVRFEAFEGTGWDEGPLAATVARVLGTRHVERCVGRDELRSAWCETRNAMDQPTIDGFNVYLVSRFAREAGIKVALSGLGGDELLGGYPSFRQVPRWAAWAARGRRVPGLAAALRIAAPLLAPGQPKLRAALDHGASLAGAYFLRRGLFLPSELPALLGPELAREGLEHYDPVRDAAKLLDGNRDAWRAVHLMESTQYMRNQLLRDADWASMAHSVELRVPLADAWLREQLADHAFEPARTGGKRALVQRVAPELPPALYARPKTGFMVPSPDWVGGPGIEDVRWGNASRRLALRILHELGVGNSAP